MAGAKYLGIDLGTTNSVGVLSDGERMEPVRTADGGSLLPSVVRIDVRGNVVVGARARRFLDTDPDNTRSEFKRIMGSGRKIAFKAAKLEKSPEELSALVLGAIRSAAEASLGHSPVAAVITVPALFELPQTRATSEAAGLAGFERVEHIQEPVASALTAGHKSAGDTAPWLVYDLGGGTFDVSLLETREGVLRVVDHDGDNFLGGRDMDARLLEYVLAALGEARGKPLSRSDPALASVFRRLRMACEDTKFELGAGKDAVVSFPEPLIVDGEEILVDVPIDARTFAQLVTPLVDKSVEVCLRLLDRQGIQGQNLGRIVLVGGPTVMPALRTRLEERIGAKLATDVDPMTAVAEGAAMFALEHGLETLSRKKAPSTAAARPSAGSGSPAEKVFLQYPSVSGDLYPFIVGRVAPGKLAKVFLERSDGEFKSAIEKVDEDGSFVVQAELTPRSANTFVLFGFDDSDKAVALEPSELVVRHGVSLADPPLSRTIGIALASGHVAVYFERGAPLPSRKTFRLRTSFTVKPGQKESAIAIPIVQGEIDLARLCRLVGTIEIKPERITHTLPVGAPVDVVLELDRGGRLSATAHLPDQNVTFPGVLSLVSPDMPLDELEKQLLELRKKTEALYSDAAIGETGKRKLIAIDQRLEEAETEREAARGADSDALEKLRRLLIDIDGSIADVEALKVWPELEQRAQDIVIHALRWVSELGSEMERRTLEEAIRSLERSRSAKNASEFSHRIHNVWVLGYNAELRDPGALSARFNRAQARTGETRDPRAARRFIGEGEAAIARGDVGAARKAWNALYELFPPNEQERVKAHGSGVER